MIALKKVIGQMMQKHNPDDDGKHITEFKKRKSAQKHASWPQDPKRLNAESAAFFDQVKPDKWSDRNALLARHVAPDEAIF